MCYTLQTQSCVNLLHRKNKFLTITLKFKVLDRLFFRGFIGPCLLAFFIVEFVLVMQTLWRVIDSILGQGYGLLDFMELIYYFGIASIPMALPLTVLLSSVMVYGDMAEKHELSSAKSSGISFIRLLRPGFVIAFCVFCLSILASNVLKPEANRGFHEKLRDMKTNKLTFAFDEQIFNNEFKGFSIRIGKKYEDGRTLDDVMIYNHTDADHSIVNMIRAQHGEMYTTPDKKYLIMDLVDGYQHTEIREESSDRLRKGHNAMARPVSIFKFHTLRKVFNLTEMLDLHKVNVDYKAYEMMNTLELFDAIDSFNVQRETAISDNIHEFVLFTKPRPDASKQYKAKKKLGAEFQESLKKVSEKSVPTSSQIEMKLAKQARIARAREKTKSKYQSDLKIFPENITPKTKSLREIVEIGKLDKVMELMKKNTMALQNHNGNHRQEVHMINRTKARYVFSLHQIYSKAMVCIIFLFIGAPAGAIVRKGGFGYPLLIAIGFFLTFVMSDIIGKKLMDSGAVSAPLGAWLPCLLLIPPAIYLSWRALHDNRPLIKPLFSKMIKRFK